MKFLSDQLFHFQNLCHEHVNQTLIEKKWNALKHF